ncbi:MAG: RES domain-containing protein [Gammaproteobacteria bacterium]|nr:MAG: RES domain-containing protein [Gammaproteobacteria bacterium]
MTYICANCVQDARLQALIRSASTNENPCDYCERESSVDLYFVADKCDDVIDTFYEVSSQTMAVIVYDRLPEGKSLEATVAELTGAPDSAVEAIVEVLQDLWYDKDSDEHQYGEDPWFVPSYRMGSTLSAQWEMIEASLRNEGRYLNPKVAAFMEMVFGGIRKDIAQDGKPVLVNAGPGTAYQTLYRARVFQNEKGLVEALEHPERCLGAPPVGSGSSGRMNAAGQPAFYGATDVDTALAEVRPVVGSWVVSAKFSIDRPLKLLDLRLLGKIKLAENLSVFDETTKAAAQRRDFLRDLCNEMVLPVMPEQQEHSYLVTQVVANYLATYPHISIDGIIYPSVQRGVQESVDTGENVVLFYKAATTSNADSEEPTAVAQLWLYEEDGPGRDFCPAIRFLEVKSAPAWYQKQDSHIAPTLSLLKDSIQIHEVKSVQVTSDVSSVDVGENYFNR